MTDRESKTELEDIINDFDSELTGQDENQDAGETSDNEKELPKKELEELSKEEIKDRFNLRFGKTPQGTSQHLVPPYQSNTYCSTTGSNNLRISEDPSPFDPICSQCKMNALGNDITPPPDTRSKAELKQWLADEINGVQESSIASGGSAGTTVSKPELAAIVSYIKSLKENQ